MALADYLRKQDPRSVRERQMRDAGRLPPGQSLTLKWPVLHTGEIPSFDPATWDLRVGGLVKAPQTLSWADLQKMPRREIVTDFHCVTRWSTFDNRWEGVPWRALLARVRPEPEATHVMVLGQIGEKAHGYQANVPLADLDRDDVMLVLRHDGADLAPEHGGPLRLLVPHLYAWKSVKWVRGIVFMDEDRPGYWERGGYHMYGDPFREQRFA